MVQDEDNEKLRNEITPGDSTVENYKKNFAELVKMLRKKNAWNRQSDLAEATGGKIPVRTISDIETGNKASIDHETVICLADAFNLEGLIREEFFNTAGLTVDRASLGYIDSVEEGIIQKFYKKTTSPAYAHDPLFSLHSVNSYLFAIFGEMLGNFRDEVQSGPNILRIWFDLQYAEKSGLINSQEWRSFVEFNVYRFRKSSHKYIHTSNYIKLVDELQRHQSFREIWRLIEKPDFIPQVSVPAIFHLSGGKRLEFLPSAVPSELPTSLMTMMLYVPTDEYTKERCLQVTTQMPLKMIRFDPSYAQGFIELPL